MTIGQIANSEAGSSVRTKLNSVIDIANDMIGDPIIYTSGGPGVIHAVEYATVSLDGVVVSGVKVTNLSTDTSKVTAYSMGGTAIYAGYWPYSAVLSTLNMGSVQAILCDVGTGNFAGLAAWNLGSVVYIVGNLSGTSTGMTSLNLASLKVLYGSFTSTFPNLTSLDLSSLETIGGGGTPWFPLMTSVDLSALVRTGGGGFGVFGDVMTALDLSALEDVAGVLGFNAPQLVTLSLPAIKYLRGGFGMGAGESAALQNFSMNSGLLLCNGDFIMSDSALSGVSVNGILVRLAALDGTGGTTAYSGHTVDLSGGTSAAPSGAGLAAKTALEGRGCTVTVN